ncbi:MAG TPA: sulfite exporter TauE/SafE family protein [Candidatus Acidoferrales bacterium]|nr:sulfite exporter TauE/SafE family protein [Candidatus Acidoferrales bacterium]
MDFLALCVIFLFSILAGIIVSMLGIGAGVMLVPFLTFVIGVPIKVAIATSLVDAITVSATASSAYIKERKTNVRLALWFAATSTVGGTTGALIALRMDRTLLSEIFAIALIVTAYFMIMRRKKVPSVKLYDNDADPFKLNSSYYDDEIKQKVNYRVKHPLLGFVGGFLSGNAAGLLGVGGGIVNVPVMNLFMNVPVKVATTTSAFIIGITAATSAAIYYSYGYIHPLLAVTVLEGIFLGAIIGPKVQGRLKSEALNTGFAVVLVVVAFLIVAKLFG